MVTFSKPRGGRGKGEGKIVYPGRRVGDYVKVLQDEVLALICPLAGKAPLKER